MATVLLYGSKPEIVRYISRRLSTAGYQVLPTLERDETLQAIATQDVDALVIGGPRAHEHREDVLKALRERHPFAPVFFPDHPDDVVELVDETFTADFH